MKREYKHLWIIHIVSTLFFSVGEGCWASREGQGCSFYITNKLKSEIFNDKKVYQQKCFSITTKNFNWEVFSKKLVTFKKKGGVNNENL